MYSIREKKNEYSIEEAEQEFGLDKILIENIIKWAKLPTIVKQTEKNDAFAK
jgi:hypothetical protein